jgi:hypothetical protein
LAKNAYDNVGLQRAQYLFSMLLALDDARFTQDRQMTGDHGQIDTAPVCHVAHGARACTFSNTHKQGEPLRIGKCFEQSR